MTARQPSPEMNKPPPYTARLAAAEIDDGSWADRGRDRALVQLARDWRAPARRRQPWGAWLRRGLIDSSAAWPSG